MHLHVFNPSHDEALAAFSPYYYPCCAARETARRFGLLPVLWASPGDYVLADLPLPEAVEAARREGVNVVSLENVSPDISERVDAIIPWGWDPLLVRQLRRAGLSERLLPDESELTEIRRLSGRETTSILLPRLVEDLLQEGFPVSGEARAAYSESEVDEWLKVWEKVMIKARWSCSGRGVFPLTVGESPARNRLRRLLREQGGVGVEPLHDVLFNFALEYEARTDGSIVPLGPSLFTTRPGGSYSTNLVASPSRLEALLAERLFPLLGEGGYELLTEIIGIRLTELLAGRYQGPVGVDLMIINQNGNERLVPCVEVNLRRTMGHAALSLAHRAGTRSEKIALLSSLSLSSAFHF